MVIRTPILVEETAVEEFRLYFEKIVSSKFAFQQALKNGHISFETISQEDSPEIDLESGNLTVLSQSILIEKVIQIKPEPVIETEAFDEDDKTRIVCDPK